VTAHQKNIAIST